jgi:hypothetical protein
MFTANAFLFLSPTNRTNCHQGRYPARPIAFLERQTSLERLSSSYTRLFQEISWETETQIVVKRTNRRSFASPNVANMLEKPILSPDLIPPFAHQCPTVRPTTTNQAVRVPTLTSVVTE